jgi:drug/metabolite transporter (DMT)-like permease
VRGASVEYDARAMPALRGRELAAYLVFSALWSGNWLVIRIGLADLPPFLFAGLRLALACVLLAGVVLGRTRGPVSGRQIRFIALVGFLQIGVSYACVFTAEQWIESGLAALLFATFALWVGLFAHWLLPDEPLTARTVAAALLGVTGVAVIQGPAVLRALSNPLGKLAAGGLLVLVSSLVSAYAVILIKKHLRGVPAFTSVLGQSVVAAVVLLGASAGFERGAAVRWTPGSIGAVAYLGVLGTLTFVGTQWLVPRVPAPVVGSFPLINTALALVWGSLLGRERLTAQALAGGALILAGVALVAFGRVAEPGPRAGPS